MIDIKNKKDCCGCQACATVCAKRCIAMEADDEGFLYPVVDKEACNDCGLCEKVCPVLNQSEPRRPLKVYAAKNKNKEIRRQSSSGGIFTLLAEKVINEGGVVFGARFDENWDVVHDWTDTIEGIAAFRGSKYVQSTIGDTYRVARDFLKQGRQVLFSGTPCQIAGLKKYLRKEYDNLLTVDVVCHGVPSPLIWRRYLNETREQLRAKCGVGEKTDSVSIYESPVITDISFRDKTNGWRRFGFNLRYAASEAALNTVSTSTIKNENVLHEMHRDNLFMQGFLEDLYLRPSCYACASRSGKSGSDIAIADFWGVENFYPEFDDDNGVGLILVNTDKGVSVYNAVEALNVEATYEQGLAGNACLEFREKTMKWHDLFWKRYEGIGLSTINQIIPRMRPNILVRIVRKIVRILLRR